MLKKSDINLKKWEFEFQQRNYQPFLMSDMYCRSLYYNHKNEINLPTDKLDYLFTSSGNGYVKSKQKRKILNKIKKTFEKNNDYLKYILKRTMEKTEELGGFANTVQISEKMSNKELSTLWEKFDKIFLKVIPWFYIPWYITEENILSDKVKKGLVKYKKEIEKFTDFNNALMALMFPIKEAMFQKEQEDFLALVRIAENNNKFQDDKFFVKKAKRYLEKYSWITTYLILPIEPLDMKGLVKKIEDAVDNKFIETYKKQKIKKAEDRKLANKIIEKLKNDKELISNIKLAQEFGWLLTFSIEQAMAFTSKLIPLFKKISKRTNTPYSLWVYLKSDEIIRILKGDLIVTVQELKKRQSGYVFLAENGIQKYIIGKKGEKLSKWIDENVDGIDKNIKEIKGQSVSPGLVEGKVRIALTPKESYRLEKGDVLVCSMTSPHYVPAMKKAAAIVTDEGGLLSHASIISRELGKPCIVRTKIATKVLKDGDLVEVDANKGVVRVLNNE